MCESRGQTADGRQAVGVQQPALEFDLTAMLFEQVRARLGQLFAQFAKFADQQFDLIAHRGAAAATPHWKS